MKDSSPSKSWRRRWRLIGGFSGDKETSQHIQSVLDAHGIGSVLEGSVLYDLWVKREHSEDAIQLLRVEAAKGWSITIRE